MRYLVFLGYETILRNLFTHLIVPPAVVNELQHAKTPARVRAWMASPPPWLEIRRPVLSPDPILMHLGAGERETLLLAQERLADPARPTLDCMARPGTALASDPT
jgi:hypothetical protein